MRRAILWDSYALDEIELVYGKAQADDNIGQLMEKLEAQALDEVRNFVQSNGRTLSPTEFEKVPDDFKENAIVTLASRGLTLLDTDIAQSTIVIRFSPMFTKVQACVIFDVLNRLEKLDGALNCLNPKWTLEIQAPLGGKKGLFQWEMLIMKLYPWLSIREISTDEVAVM